MCGNTLNLVETSGKNEFAQVVRGYILNLIETGR